jgi:plastocyanin
MGRGVVALAAGVLSVGPAASAGHAAITIQVGSVLRGAPAESMRFHAPDTITVHQGDRMTFDFHGFHTATLLPAGVGADDWLHDNANETGAPFAFVHSDPDDGTGEYKDNFGFVVTPTQTTCGRGDQEACAYTGDAVLNSGAPQEPGETFTATINAEPGSTFWIVCLIHHNMRLRVKVTGDPATATTQETIDEARRAQVARDTDWARATHTKYSAKRTSHRTASGRRVWDAWAGVDSRWVSLFAFYPKRLVIQRGDTVRWRFDSLVMEDHTVSMPVPSLFGNLVFDQAMCDPDTDSGAGPDTPAEETDQGPVCPEGSQLEIDIGEQFWGGVGNGVLTGNRDVEHSGIRGSQAAHLVPPAAGQDSFDVKFMERTGRRPVTYICFLHPMDAEVVVE